MKDMQGYIRAAGLLKPPPAPQQVLPVDPIFQNVLFTNISILILSGLWSSVSSPEAVVSFSPKGRHS